MTGFSRFRFLLSFVVMFLLGSGVVLYRLPGCDEAWFLNPVVNFFSKGTTGTDILEVAGTNFDGLQRYTFWQPPLYFVSLGFWTRVFGAGLFSIRYLSLFAGLVTLFAWISVFRALRLPPATVWLASLVIACDYTFVMRATDARMDMVSAAFGVSALATYLTLRENNLPKAFFLANCLLVCSGLTHPAGGVLNALGFAALVLFYDRKRLTLPIVASAMLPYIVGLAAWGLYMAQDFHLFRKIFSANAGDRFDGIASPWTSLRREVVDRYLVSFGLKPGVSLAVRLKLIIPVTYWASFLFALFTPSLRRRPQVQVILLLICLFATTLFLIDNNKFAIYLVHLYPLSAGLLAIVLEHAHTNRFLPRPLLVTFFFCFLLLQAGGLLSWVSKDGYHKDYLPAAKFLSGHMKPGQMLMGPAEFTFALGWDLNLIDDSMLGYRSGKNPDIIVMDARYRDMFDYRQRTMPEAYQFMVNRRDSEFKPVYQNSSYLVLFRK